MRALFTIGAHREIQFRMRFAEMFPTEDEVRNAVSHFGSWHAIVNEALRDAEALFTIGGYARVRAQEGASS